MRPSLGAPGDLGQIAEHQRHPVDHGGVGEVYPGSGRSWLWAHRHRLGARSREVDLQEDRDASTRSARRSHHGSAEKGVRRAREGDARGCPDPVGSGGGARALRMRKVSIQPVRAGLLRVVDLDHDLFITAIRRRHARSPRGARHERRGALWGCVADEGRETEEGHTLRRGQGLGLGRRMDGGWMERSLVRDGRQGLFHEGARVGRALLRSACDLPKERALASVCAHNRGFGRSEEGADLAARPERAPAARTRDHLAFVPSDAAFGCGPGPSAGQRDRASSQLEEPEPVGAEVCSEPQRDLDRDGQAAHEEDRVGLEVSARIRGRGLQSGRLRRLHPDLCHEGAIVLSAC